MFCKYCGKELNDGSKFCKYCGSALAASENPVQDAGASEDRDITQSGDQSHHGNAGTPREGRYVTQNIVLCADGKYRWIYELSLWKNPTILITTAKVLALSVGIVFLLLIIFDIVDGASAESILGTLKIFFIMMLIMAVLLAISYPIYCLLFGGKYIVVFEMDEKEIVHTHAPRQFQKMQAMTWLMTFVGAVKGDIGMIGQSMYLRNADSRTSEYKNVTKVKSVRSRNVIYVDSGLFKNQVYVAAEDFDFVENFLRSRCEKAKIL